MSRHDFNLSHKCQVWLAKVQTMSAESCCYYFEMGAECTQFLVS